MRLFVALDIDDSIRQRILRFVEGVRGFAAEARWIRPESLHITLKFIGEQPEDVLAKIQQSLSAIRVHEIDITFRGFGFFPTAKSARVFWIGIEAGPALTSLAASVDDALVPLGIAKEEHAYHPHMTLARGGSHRGVRSGSPNRLKGDEPNRSFTRLQEKLAPMPIPEFGTMTARDFFLYRSQLSPAGSRYTKISSFALQATGATGPH